MAQTSIGRTPAALWIMSGNTLPQLDTQSSPPGQRLYVISKLAALYAVALIGLQLALLMLRIRVTKHHRTRGWTGHRILGLLTLITVTAHVTAFVLATSVRNGEFSLHLLAPVLGGGFYRTMISIGSLGLWLCIVGALFQLRVARRIRLRWMHPYLMMTAALLVIVHSYAIGSESGTNVVAIFYGLLLLLILSLWVVRRSRTRRITNTHTELKNRVELR